MLWRRQVKLKLKQADFDAQVDEFLVDAGFEANDNYRALFGSMVQMMPQDQDWFSPDLVARMIRKAIVNEKAFYLIHPEKRPKSETDTTSTTTEVVQKVS